MNRLDNMEGNNFRYFLDNFRGLAIIFVMLSHLTSFHTMGRFGDYIYFLVGGATAWFVFISGYLFYYLERGKFNYSDYLSKKAMYVILPYLLLSIPAICTGLYFAWPTLIGLNSGEYIAWSLLVGGNVVGPMWFIPMIIIFFVMTPVFNLVAKSWMLYVFAAMALVFSLFSSRPIHNLNALLSFFHFLGFYMLGLVFSAQAIRIAAIKSSVKTGIIVVSLAAFALAAFFYQDAESILIGFQDGLGIFNLLLFGKLLLLIAIFFIFEKFFDQPNKVLGYFAKISFGLFFIHGFYILIFVKIAKYMINMSAASMLVVEFWLVIIGSFATVFVLKHMFNKRSRYVIGC